MKMYTLIELHAMKIYPLLNKVQLHEDVSLA